jgi:hypothetical protein
MKTATNGLADAEDLRLRFDVPTKNQAVRGPPLLDHE